MGQDLDAEQQFGQFVALRGAALHRTAYLLVGDWGLAEDLVQTALIKTYLAWRRLGGIEPVEAYARRVLVNTATRWWRRKWRGELSAAAPPDRSVADRVGEFVERDRVWRMIMVMPARQRAVLVLRFYEDLTEAETARLLDVSVGTVKSQTARAMGSLRKRLRSAEEPVGTTEGSGR